MSNYKIFSFISTGTHWMWEILMMLTRSSAEHRSENKHDMMLEIGFGSNQELLKPGNRRIINTHLRYDDMPPSIINNTRLEMLRML